VPGVELSRNLTVEHKLRSLSGVGCPIKRRSPPVLTFQTIQNIKKLIIQMGLLGDLALIKVLSEEAVLPQGFRSRTKN
jgi:hypothetical protein